jgi:NTE family protein
VRGVDGNSKADGGHMRKWLSRLTGRGPSSERQFVLALGGGGGRGLAHLGVLDVLEEHDLRPRAIIGSSIGSLFGAMYALNPDAKQVIERVTSFLRSPAFAELNLPVIDGAEVEDQTWLSALTAAARQTMLFTRAATGIAVSHVENLVKVAHTLCDGKGFGDLVIPMHVCAVRFPSGECHVFDEGDLVRSVAASMAVPGVFEPLLIDGEKYVDGGLSSEVPAREARQVADNDVVVAVNVGARPDPNFEPSNVLSMLDWSTRVKALYLRRFEKALADVLIEPLVGFRQWHDFSRVAAEIEVGREAALEQLPLLRQLLAR